MHFLCCSLLVVVILYFLIGIIFMKFAKKAQGPEIIPNIEFWKGLPSLVKVNISYRNLPYNPSQVSLHKVKTCSVRNDLFV